MTSTGARPFRRRGGVSHGERREAGPRRTDDLPGAVAGRPGRQRKKSFTKKGDADRYAATVEADKTRGTYVEPSKITVAEYARTWAEARPHRATTARRTEMMVRLHIDGDASRWPEARRRAPI